MLLGLLITHACSLADAHSDIAPSLCLCVLAMWTGFQKLASQVHHQTA